MARLSPKTVMTGVGVYFAAATGGYLYLRSTKAPPAPCGCGGTGRHADGGAISSGSGQSEAGGLETFDRIADRYDSCINVDETVMGIKLMRRWLMRQAEVGRAHGPALSGSWLAGWPGVDGQSIGCMPKQLPFLGWAPLRCLPAPARHPHAPGCLRPSPSLPAGRCAGGVCWHGAQPALLQPQPPALPNPHRHQPGDACQCTGQVSRAGGASGCGDSAL